MTKAIAKVEETWWTADREKCLDRVMAGWGKKQIADDLNVHRNTINNWCAHPEFIKRLAESNADKRDTYKQRRVHETNMFADRVAKLATKALDRAEKYPTDHHSMRTAREWLSEYKDFREQERVDMGENVQRHQHAVLGHVQHTHALSQASFKGFMEDAIGKGIIDATAIESGDIHALVTMVTQQALLGTDLLDQLAEEEREIAIDVPLTSSERK